MTRMTPADTNVPEPADEDMAAGGDTFVKVTDLADGTARIELERTLPWPATLELLRFLQEQADD
jgi:hypothetical protein